MFFSWESPHVDCFTAGLKGKKKYLSQPVDRVFSPTSCPRYCEFTSLNELKDLVCSQWLQDYEDLGVLL